MACRHDILAGQSLLERRRFTPCNALIVAAVTAIFFASFLVSPIHEQPFLFEPDGGLPQQLAPQVGGGEESVYISLQAGTREGSWRLGALDVPSARRAANNSLLVTSPLSYHRLSPNSDRMQMTTAATQQGNTTTVPPPTEWTSALTTIFKEELNCTALMKRDSSERKKAKRLLTSGIYKNPTDESFLVTTKPCSEFRDKRTYPSRALSDLEAKFPLAYSIRMHENVAQVERLLRAIYMPQHVYCIHIDINSPRIIHQSMKAIADCFPNVFISALSVNYIYGGFSPVEVDLHCMKELLATGVKWKYYLNLAGTEYPLKTNLEITRILQYLNGTNDIEQIPFPDNLKYRLDKKYVTLRLSRKHIMSNSRKEPFQNGTIELMKGCSYNTFSRAFVEWVLVNPLAQELIEWSREISSPDELVWATLNHLSGAPGGYQVHVSQVHKDFLSREIIWRWSTAYCYGEYVHHICILGYEDLKWLNRRWELFANKFNTTKDPIAIECLEKQLSYRTKYPDTDHTVNWKRIMRMPHVAAVKGIRDFKHLI